MLSDFKTSIDKILHERLTSPFWGAFILSWFIWNWRIPYVSIFVDQDKLKEGTTRIDYIVTECLTTGWVNVLWLPLASTAIIILVFPFISNGAYWISLKFNKWKVDKKNHVDGQTLLTLEKSVQLREQLNNLTKRYDAITKDSEEQIRILNLELAQQKETLERRAVSLSEKDELISQLKISDKNYEDAHAKNVRDIQNLKDTVIHLREELGSANKKLKESLNDLSQKNIFLFKEVSSKYSIQDMNKVLSNILKRRYFPDDSVIPSLLLRHDFVSVIDTSGSSIKYELTEKGKQFREYFYNEIYK